MAYKALYRTYRPQKFEDVIGQETIVKTLKNALANDRITHAYLFSGPRGTGKTTIARILAKALNCSHREGSEPCNECTSCKEIMEGSSPDVIEIDAASNNGVDEIREIRERVKFLPSGAKYKIYIIDEVHMLTTSAFNALLKTLEEPPKHVIFILATTEPQKVLPTILSRCQRYDFKSLTVDEIAASIKKICDNENIKITEEAVISIAESAEGGLRDAHSFLDQAISLSDDEVTVEDVNSVTGNLSYDKTIELATCFQNKDISKALEIVNDLLNMGKEVNKIITTMLQFYRDVLLYKNVNTSEYRKYIFAKPAFKELAENIDERKLFYYVDVLSDTQGKLRLSTTSHIFLEIAIIKMINVSDNDLDLLNKVKALQEKIDEIDAKGLVKVEASNNNNNVDNNQLKLVDEKVNRVITELGKLELPKVIQRVNDLENNGSAPSNNSNNFEKDIDKIKEDLSLIKANYNALQNIQENSAPIIDEDLINRVNNLENAINQLKEEKSYSEDKLNDIITDRLLDANLNGNVDYKQIEDFVEEKIHQNNRSNNQVDETNLNARIEYLEDKVYKIISGTLINQPTIGKKSRNNNENQTCLFGDDVTTIADLEKRPIKERVDFEGLEREDIKRQRKEQIVESIEREEVEEIVEESPIQFEKTVMAVPIEHENEQEKVKNNETEEVDEELPQEEIIAPKRPGQNAKDALNKSMKDMYLQRDKEESTVDLYGTHKYESDSPAERALNNSLSQLSADTRPHSQLVIRVNGEDQIVTPKSQLFSGEREQLHKKLSNAEPVAPAPQEPSEEEKQKMEEEARRVQKESLLAQAVEVDEYASYDVSVIERILNDARTPECRNDKNRLTNLWSRLPEMAPDDKKNIAQLLADGAIAAVGNREFILVYSTASICNQVMRKRFKRESLKLLYDLLGDLYNYMALPEGIWLDKRKEYANQYNIGSKEIHLQPINEPALDAMSDDGKDLTPEEEMLENIKNLFGDDVEIK